MTIRWRTWRLDERLSWRLCVAVAVLLFSALCLDAARKETPTIDEFAHVPSGAAVLRHGRTDLYPNNPPLFRVLLALPVVWAGAHVPPVEVPVRDWGPWSYGAVFQDANQDRYFDYYARARAVTVFAGLLAAALLFFWSRELVGERTACIVTTLFLLSPTVLAHAHLATIDMACAASFTASVFSYAWMERAPSPRRVALAGAIWGVALSTKFTALLLVPSWLTLAFARRAGRGRALLRVLGLGIAALCTVNALMGFADSMRPLGAFTFHSNFATGLQAALPQWLPVPLPADYLIGFDLQKQDTEMGELGSYLLGEWSLTGWWYYNFVALAVKVPLPTLALIAASIVRLRRADDERWRFVWIPLAWLLFILCFANRLNIGVRYLLPAFPLAFVLMGLALSQLAPGRARLVGIPLMALFAGNALWTHPGYLSYFNVLAGGHGERILADSNLDIGQDLYRLPEALETLGAEAPPYLLYFGHVHPRLYGIDFKIPPNEPVRGIVVASVGYLLGATYVAPAPDGSVVWVSDRARLAWLRDKRPTLRAGTLWIYDLR